MSATPCRAVIDVGTNSTKLLVGSLHDHAILPLHERGIQTRLGSGLFQSRRLLPDAIARTAHAVRELRAEALSFQPERLRILATAAAREALNADALLAALAQVCPEPVEVLSGEQEAELAFRGVCTDPRLTHLPLLVTDVGGGSSEFILGRSGHRDFSQSHPLGAVRLFESLQLPDRPGRSALNSCRNSVDEFLRDRLSPAIAAVRDAALAGRPFTLVGVGGTVAILARIAQGIEVYDRSRLEASVLPAELLCSLTERLWDASLDERRRLPGLPPERADIILTGAALHEAILRVFQLPSLTPSTRGLRFAALRDSP